MYKKLISLILSITCFSIHIYAEPLLFDLTNDNLTNVMGNATGMTFNDGLNFIESTAVNPTMLTPEQVLDNHELTQDTLSIAQEMFTTETHEIANDLTHPTIEIPDASDALNGGILQTTPDENLAMDLTEDTLNNVNNDQNDNPLTQDEILVSGTIETPTDETKKEDSDGDGASDTEESKSTDTDGEKPENPPTDEDGDMVTEDEFPLESDNEYDGSAYLFDFIPPIVYADETLTTNDSNDKYYLKTATKSYLIDSKDESLMFFIKLIANKNIEIEALATQESKVKISLKYISVLEEIDEVIWDKYNNYCLDKIAEEYPTGVFFLENEIHYFADHNTDKIYQVKTDDYLLQILIPLIVDKGIKVSINGYYISETVVYVSEVILQENLPDEIAEEYKQQYKNFMKTTLYNFTGTLQIINNEVCIVTNEGTFKLSSTNNDILAFIISYTNTNATVRVHGYLDIDTNIIDVQQIDY